MGWRLLSILSLFTLCFSCEPDTGIVVEPHDFAGILYPGDNPTTAAGLDLGRRLFFDPILSGDSTVSCATCHRPGAAFADNLALSIGANGRTGRRNTPSLTNIGYLHRQLFWDGRADDLESQALHPVANPDEMGGDWPLIISRLRRHYPEAFRAAFGISFAQLQPHHVGRALAQYQRSLISNTTKYDRVRRGEAAFTPEEALGEAIFFDFADDTDGPFAGLPTGECAHCHVPPHFTNQAFFNNGLDEIDDLDAFTDPGRGAVTGNPFHNGLFRTPGLRNVALTAPYMHDGRMQTLEEVIEHYDSGGHYAENRSPNVRPLGLDRREKAALVAFLTTLTDSLFVNKHYVDAR